MKQPVEDSTFTNLVDRALSVSREEIQRREREYRKRAEANVRKRGPKRRVKPSASDLEAIGH